MTGTEVTVGSNKAVMVRFGVGNTKGVGEATKGKLHASMDIASTTRATSSARFLCFTPASHPGKFPIEHTHYR
jgi:hypothetical protein